MSDVYGTSEEVSRFEIMDLWTDEEREKLQLEREKAGCCEYCGSNKNPTWTQSMTAYHWDRLKTMESPNRSLFLCFECYNEYMEYWSNMWEEYNYSRW